MKRSPNQWAGDGLRWMAATFKEGRVAGWWSRVVPGAAVPWLRVGLFVIVSAWALQAMRPADHQLDIRVEGESPERSVAEVYYAHDARLFRADQRQTMIRRSEAERTVFLAQIRSDEPVRALRLDLSDVPGTVRWSGLRLTANGGEWDLQGEALQKASPAFDQLELLASDAQGFNLQATGSDPKITLFLPPELTAYPAQQQRARWIGYLLAAPLLALVLEALYRSRAALARWGGRLVAALRRLSSACSEAPLIRFSPGALAVYAVLFLMACGWVALKLQQSSIGVWDQMYVSSVPHYAIQLGYPKAIRSDEWNTFTPWMLSQVQTGMQMDNPNIGAPASAILTGAPVMGPLMLAQPKFWGFVLFDIERGFSWYWAFKTFGLIAAVFTLLLLLTRGDTLVSLAGGLGVFGSSFVQWWFSGIPSELIIGCAVSVVGSVYLLQSAKPGGMLAGAALVALVVPNLLMHLYPPHLLPLAYLSVFLLLGLLLRPASWSRWALHWRWRLFLAGAALLVWVWLGSTWWQAGSETIRLMMNTVYPGRRFELGGGLPLYYVFHGIFESWKLELWPVPFPPTNQTAASQMWTLFPLALLVLPWRDWTRAAFRPAASLLLFCLMVLCWTSMPLPESLRLAMAYAGWSMAPSWNSAIGMGLASILLMCVLVAAVARGEPATGVNAGAGQQARQPASRVASAFAAHRVSLALTLLVAAGIVAYGTTLRSLDAEFFVWPRILLAAVAVAALFWSVRQGARRVFFALSVLIALPPLHVNPVQNGLHNYLNKDVLADARAVGGQAGDLWAVYGDTNLAQGFKSVGLQVLNGTHYAPRMDRLKLLDPSAQYAEVWNRYAHTALATGAPGTPPVFRLDFPDSYTVLLDVCGPSIRALGVTHVAYSYPPSEAETACLEPQATRVRVEGVRYFRLR